VIGKNKVNEQGKKGAPRRKPSRKKKKHGHKKSSEKATRRIVTVQGGKTPRSKKKKKKKVLGTLEHVLPGDSRPEEHPHLRRKKKRKSPNSSGI